MPNILDTLDVIENLSAVYENDRAFSILKDFERVIDELGLYVYENWEDGELVAGPEVDRHWVKCSFMWPRKKMPDPQGGKRLLDYDCKVQYQKSEIIKARKIIKPDDIRPGTKKGKLDKIPVWVVHIQMPKSLIIAIYGGDVEKIELEDKAQATQPAPAVGGMPAPIPPAPAPAAAPAAAPAGGAATPPTGGAV
jgi:hypothetical protein